MLAAVLNQARFRWYTYITYGVIPTIMSKLSKIPIGSKTEKPAVKSKISKSIPDINIK